jgi:hypothetical protein
MFRQSIEVAAEPGVLFDLTQDYSHRLDWDPFLKEARLLDGAERPGVGVRAWCVARNGLGMETRYVSFNPPGACAVEMTRGPWFFRSFSGSWRFDRVGPDGGDIHVQPRRASGAHHGSSSLRLRP